jgi:hypothetical protein
MRIPQRLLLHCLTGVALAVGVATPSHAYVIFNFNASQPIQSFSAAVGVINPNFTYNPSTQGAITSLNFSVQTEQVQNFVPFIPPNGTVGASALIYQNGNFFAAQARAPFPGDGIWIDISATGWTATNFQLINLTGATITDSHGVMVAPGAFDTGFNPDFSATGGPIEFGTGGTFAFLCGSGGATNLSCPFLLREFVARQNMVYTINDPIMFSDTDFSDIGNYNIIDLVTASDPAGAVNSNVTVPEPSSLTLFIAGLLALAGLARSAPRRSFNKLARGGKRHIGST